MYLTTDINRISESQEKTPQTLNLHFVSLNRLIRTRNSILNTRVYPFISMVDQGLHSHDDSGVIVIVAESELFCGVTRTQRERWVWILRYYYILFFIIFDDAISENV